MGYKIVVHRIGIRKQLYRLERLIRCSVKYPKKTGGVIAVCRVNPIHVSTVNHVVGHPKSAEAVKEFPGGDSVHFNGPVIFCHREETAALGVKRKAVKVAQHRGHEFGIHGLRQLLLGCAFVSSLGRATTSKSPAHKLSNL